LAKYPDCSNTTLKDAAFYGNLERLRSFDPKVMEKDSESSPTVLDCAIMGQNFEVVEYLIQLNAKPTNQSLSMVYSKGITEASTPNSPAKKIIKFLLDKGFRETFVTDFYHFSEHSTFFHSISANDLETVKMFLDTHPSIPKNNSIYLAEAFLTENKELVEFLLSNGFLINSSEINSQTVLHDLLSREFQNKRAIEMALQKGVNPNSEGAIGLTPLMLTNSEEILNLLLKYKADINHTNGQGVTPAMYFSSKGNYSIVKLLIDRGSDLKRKDSNGDTALHYATKSSNHSIMPLLLKSGADPNAQNLLGKKPVDYLNVSNFTMAETGILEYSDSSVKVQSYEGNFQKTITINERGNKSATGNLYLDKAVLDPKLNFLLIFSHRNDSGADFKYLYQFVIYDLKTGEENAGVTLGRFDRGFFPSAKFSPDGKSLVIFIPERGIEFWQINNKEWKKILNVNENLNCDLKKMFFCESRIHWKDESSLTISMNELNKAFVFDRNGKKIEEINIPKTITGHVSPNLKTVLKDKKEKKKTLPYLEIFDLKNPKKSIGSIDGKFYYRPGYYPYARFTSNGKSIVVLQTKGEAKSIRIFDLNGKSHYEASISDYGQSIEWNDYGNNQIIYHSGNRIDPKANTILRQFKIVDTITGKVIKEIEIP